MMKGGEGAWASKQGERLLLLAPMRAPVPSHRTTQKRVPPPCLHPFTHTHSLVAHAQQLLVQSADRVQSRQGVLQAPPPGLPRLRDRVGGVQPEGRELGASVGWIGGVLFADHEEAGGRGGVAVVDRRAAEEKGRG